MSTAIESKFIETTELNRDPIVSLSTEIVIADHKSFGEAGILLGELIKPMIKEIKASTDPVCEATNKAHKAATAQRKALLAPLLEAETLVKAKINGYLDEQERLQIAAQADFDADMDECGGGVIPMPLETSVKGISTRKTWEAEVTDFAELVLAVAAGHAPISLLEVNTTKLRQQINALDGMVDYPGVRVFEKRVVSGRRLTGS